MNLRQPQMKKNRRIPLAVKMNILVSVMILCTCALLIIISNGAYNKTVIEPYVLKMEGIKVDTEAMKPFLAHFLDYVGTEELDAIWTEDREERAGRLMDWMQQQPSFLPNAEDEERTLLNDWVDFSLMPVNIRADGDLNAVDVAVRKNGTYYSVCSEYKQDINLIEADEGNAIDFGMTVNVEDLAPEDYGKAKWYQVDKSYLLARSVQIGLDGTDALVCLSYDLTDMMGEHKNYLLRCVLFTLSLTVAASAAGMFLMRRYITRPVRRLAQATKEFTPEENGTYSAEKISKVEVRNRDEIGDLSRDIRSMQERIVENADNLARMTAEKERVSTELDLARDIQASLLPDVFPAFPDRHEFSLYASMTPAREVGGDFYDFFLIDDDHLALVIADVSGKGIPAALFMAVSRTVIRDQLMSGCDPVRALERANAQLCSENPHMMFVTVWLAVVEISTGKGVACNAGHEHPAVRRAGGAFELVKYKHDRPAGFIPDTAYHSRKFELRPGDTLLVYTDGVPEANNPQKEMFGEERMTETLNRYADAEPEELIRRMYEAVASFADGTDQFDDITMLAVKYYGRENGTGKTGL